MEYIRRQGWCRTDDTNYSNEDPPFLFQNINPFVRSASQISKDKCKQECSERSWCVAAGFANKMKPSERCRLHATNMQVILNNNNIDGSFRMQSGHPEINACTTRGNGNATSECFIKSSTF